MSAQARFSQTTVSSDSRRASKMAPFYGPLRMAARRVRLERGLSLAIASFPAAVFLSIAWVVLLRFTLLDLPQWPVLLPVAAWTVALLIAISRIRVSTAQSARYLDRKLTLDERLATYVELLSRQRRGIPSEAAKRHIDELANSAKELLKAVSRRMPGIGVHAGRNRLVMLAVPVAILAATLIVPTPLDSVRAEKLRFAQSISAQLQRIADLRADYVARPQIPDATRSALLAELDRLEAKLKTLELTRLLSWQRSRMLRSGCARYRQICRPISMRSFARRKWCRTRSFATRPGRNQTPRSEPIWGLRRRLLLSWQNMFHLRTLARHSKQGLHPCSKPTPHAASRGRPAFSPLPTAYLRACFRKPAPLFAKKRWIMPSRCSYQSQPSFARQRGVSKVRQPLSRR